MSQQNISRAPKWDYLILVPIMVLAFYIAFIPHLNYPYPVHIDEWFHMAFSNEIIREASAVNLSSPFSGGEPEWNQSVQLGFHVFSAVFHQISGIPWLDTIRYFPSIIFMITVLSTYVLAQRQGFGWEAAFFACLVPTSVGILGPAFFVPVAMALLFIPLCIFIAFNFRTVWSYLVLFIFTCFVVSMHATTAVGIVIILVPFILLNMKGDFKHSLGIILALALPFLAPLPGIFDLLKSTPVALFSPKSPAWFVDLPRVIHTYGYLPIFSCLLGTFLLAIRGRQKDYGLILGLLALLLMLVTFFTFHYGVIPVYERGLIYTMLLMSIVAGAGLMGVKNFRLPLWLSERVRAPIITQNVGIFLCLILIGLTLVTCIPLHQRALYYHMITEQDYEAFIWMKENIDSDYDKAILDPWKATPFTAVTGKKVHARIHLYPEASDEEAYNFLRDGCKDTNFLKENDISIIYTQWPCHNLELVEVQRNIYLIK